MVNPLSTLPEFSSIGLSELERVSLLDRMDTKYIFTTDHLGQFLQRLVPDYFILEINNKRIFSYESLYFDTDDLKLYNQHQCGRMNRYKIRFRKYVDSGICFFEIKFKNNKGRTVKSRISQMLSQGIEGEALNLLHDKAPTLCNSLKPVIWVNYQRITLVSRDYSERLTLDLDLTFKNNDTEKTISNLVIAEVKQNRASQSSFTHLMKEFNIRSGSISKYCLGIINLFNKIRVNNFKPQLLYLNKVIYAAPTGY